MEEETPQVWLYYWRYMGRYVHAYADLTTAMLAAESLLDCEEGAVETIVDTDGTEYEDFEAVRAWMKVYRQDHPLPPEPASAPPTFRTFRDQEWQIESEG